MDSVSSKFERLLKKASSQQKTVMKPDTHSELSSLLSSIQSTRQIKLRPLVAFDSECLRVFVVATDETHSLKTRLQQHRNRVVEYDNLGNYKEVATKFMDSEIGSGKYELGDPIREVYCGYTCNRFPIKSSSGVKDANCNRSQVCFRMKIEDVWSIRGRGTVVTGKILSGSLNVGDEISIYGGTKVKKTIVTGIERRRLLLDYAEAGDDVGVLLRGVDSEDVRQGYVLRKDI